MGKQTFAGQRLLENLAQKGDMDQMQTKRKSRRQLNMSYLLWHR